MIKRRVTMWWSQAWCRFACSTLLAVGLIAPTLAQTPRPATPQVKVTIGFVEIEGDPRHEPLKAYGRLVLKTRDHPFAGAQVGIEEAQAISRVLKIDFALERITVKSTAELAPAMLEAMDARNLQFFIIDAPAETFGPLAAAVRGRDVLLFNATAPEDSLRREICAREIVHTLPSLAHEHGRPHPAPGPAKWRDFSFFMARCPPTC